ncbi:MAG: hypothetical protein AB1697_03790 [Pseudomonadota bacterium]
MQLTVRPAQAVLCAPDWQAAQPLWQRVPKRDADGALLADFMMIAPALKRCRPDELTLWLARVEGALKRFESSVVFADFNLRLNLLWVSHRSQPGLGARLVAALRAAAPELRLVAHAPDLPD